MEQPPSAIWAFAAPVLVVIIVSSAEKLCYSGLYKQVSSRLSLVVATIIARLVPGILN